MGKKKAQKSSKEIIAVAVAAIPETSTSKSPDDGGAQSVQPRKRGRPRKVLDEPHDQQGNNKLPPLPPDVSDKPPEKKPKTTGDEPPPPAAFGGASKQQEPKSGEGSRSRGRRKNKPRKSS